MRRITYIFIIMMMCSGCGFMKGHFKGSPEKNVPQDSFIKRSSLYFSEAEPVIQWWTLFNDPQLNDIIEKAINNNLEVKSAQANIDRARATLRQVNARYFPVVDGEASYTRERSSLNGNAPLTERTTNTYKAGFDSIWEIDLFGRLSQRIAQAEALNEQLKADLQSVYVSVTAEVARYYIQLRGAQHLLDIAQKNAANQEKTFELIQSMSEGGRGTHVDVVRAQGQWESTLSSIPLLQSDIDTAIFRLSVLTGQEPNALYDQLKTTKALPSLPVSFGVGKPETLLKRRPDIRSAQEKLEQVVRQYNLAVGEWFPKINITGGIGFLSSSLGDLTKSDSMTNVIGPSISWRVLDFDRINSGIKEADADIEVALATYQNTVLQALEEVQSSMTQFTYEEKRRFNLYRSAESNREAARLARVRYESGLDSFLDVLDAEQRQLQSENALAQSEIQSAFNLISLYKALGGGWELNPEVLP